MDRIRDADWMGLCEQAASEQDPDKVVTLLLRITMLLKEHRLKELGPTVN